MIIKLLLALAASSTSIYSFPPERQPEKKVQVGVVDEINTFVNKKYGYNKLKPLDRIKAILQKESPALRARVITSALTTLQCAQAQHIPHNNLLTIIDYSLPSSEKRLWVFDLQKEKLLFHTYVSHGITSGRRLTDSFSNKHNSKASSLGVYHAENSYYGRHGLSLKLNGLERGFNDNAFNRAIVMHGGWYVDEAFVKKYGRAGRSWGCPALPSDLTVPIINTIKDKSLFVAYYPSNSWLSKSKFLNCYVTPPMKYANSQETEQIFLSEQNTPREAILFADLNDNNQREENEPVVVISADNYAYVFDRKVPLTRMLRRQINKAEYVALTDVELNNLLDKDKLANSDNRINFDDIYFVIPVVKMQRGYYATEMKPVDFGKIIDMKFGTSPEQSSIQALVFEKKSLVNIKSTARFIRWLGL